jgi:hypothetical protein
VLAAATAPGLTAVALDAPFGWPCAMVGAVSAWRPGRRWQAPTDTPFRQRRTDAATVARTKSAVNARRAAGEVGLRPAVPLSVSADKIAMAAWRSCGILDALVQREAVVVTDVLGAPFPSDGQRRVVEAYPAAALALWGIPRQGYKSAGPMAVGVREAMLGRIERASAKGWLRWAPGARARCAVTDHALDAFVCALVARAAYLGLVDPVPPEEGTFARAEGWIALPLPDALRSLPANLPQR